MRGCSASDGIVLAGEGRSGLTSKTAALLNIVCRNLDCQDG